MEQTKAKRRVTTYQLAMLAARIWPRICVDSPARAIAAAERLLQEAEAAIRRAYQEERRKEEELEEKYMPRINWVTALKQITGQSRRDRALKRFIEFENHDSPAKSKQQLKEHVNAIRRQKFSEYEIDFLQDDYMNWLKEPKRKKGKQGRRISEHDRRLRIGSFRLISKKTAKRV